MPAHRPQLNTAALVEQALRDSGSVQLATVVAGAVPVARLRDLARRFDLAPKGFRIERAPAAVLAKQLATAEDPDVLDAVCTELAQRLTPPAEEQEPAQRKEDPHAHAKIVSHLEQQRERLQAKLDRAREATARHRAGEADLTRQLVLAREVLARQRAENRALTAAPLPGNQSNAEQVELQRRLHTALRDLASLEEAEEQLRLRTAEQNARIRELEHEVEDLTERVPKGRRRRKEPPPPPPPVADVFRVPVFSHGFYKSLESKDRRSVAQALQAIVLFCVEGPSYPGLEVKRLEGSSMWSLRAARKLRVFFALNDDRTMEVIELVDREEQHTSLRRLKDRHL